jgi:tetratricopeptide (TPR) repeat protein
MYIYTRRTVFRLTCIIALLFIISGCDSITVRPPYKSPIAASETEEQILRQAEKLYHQGKYEAALPKIQETLNLNPNNVEAIHAMALSCMALEQYNKSLEYSKRAAAYKSKYLEDTYLLMGAAYQQLNDHWNALRTYRFAASEYPNNAKIQYRLGDTYVYLSKPELASDAFKAAILADPDDAASHYQLGMIYYAYDYHTPAILALSTSLLFDPVQPSAVLIIKDIIELLGQAPESHQSDEGDFYAVDTALAEKRAAQFNSNPEHAFDTLKVQYHTLFSQLNTENISKQKTFVINNYVPLYNKIHSQQLDETFVYYIFQGSKDKNISKWLKEHPEKVRRLKQLIT